jgi:GxxExxY protein
MSLLHEEITGKILETSFEVINELGAGFLEGVYEKALAIALREKRLNIQTQVPLRISFRGHCVGEYYADLLVENKVIVELKAVKTLTPEHQAQVINYLKATAVSVGLLINFGHPKLEYRRLFRPETKSQENAEDGQDCFRG